MLKPIIVVKRNGDHYKGYDCINLDEAFAVAGNDRLGDLVAVYKADNHSCLHVEYSADVDVDAISDVVVSFTHPVEYVINKLESSNTKK